MNLGTIARAFGMSIPMGLGTAQEQRENALRMLALVESTRGRQEALALQREQLAETKRTHDLQHGPASEAEVGFYRPILESLGIQVPPGAVTRQGLRELYHYGLSAGAQEPMIELDPQDYRVLGTVNRPQARDIPGTGTRAQYDEADQLIQEPVPPRKSVTVKASSLNELLNARRTQAKEDRTRREQDEKQRQIALARSAIAGGQTWEQIAASYPTLTAKDVHGYEPTAPDRTEKRTAEKEAHVAKARAEIQGGKTWEQIATAYPGLTAKDVYGYEPVAPEKPENPDEKRRKKATADLAELRVQGERDRQEAAGILDQIRNGKPVSEEKVRRAVAAHQDIANRWMKAAEAAEASLDDASASLNRSFAQDAARMARELQAALRPKTPKAAGGSVDVRGLIDKALGGTR